MVPQAFDQLDAGTPVVSLGLTPDSAADLTPISQDAGASVSVGPAIRVGA